jgi:hypothetical protein
VPGKQITDTDIWVSVPVDKITGTDMWVSVPGEKITGTHYWKTNRRVIMDYCCGRRFKTVLWRETQSAAAINIIGRRTEGSSWITASSAI